MIIQWLRNVPFSPAVKAFGVGLVVWLVAAPSARALPDGVQLLSGGNSMFENSTWFTAPGLPHQYAAGTLGGKSEKAAMLRMPAGTLSRLLVRVTTENVPTSGGFTVTVRINGADTALTCQVTLTGNCGTAGTTVNVPNGGRLTVRVSNGFVGAGNMAYTYTLLFD